MMRAALLTTLMLSSAPVIAQSPVAVPSAQAAASSSAASATPVGPSVPTLGSPEAAVDALRHAALAGDAEQAGVWLAPDLMLVSQSGKVYGRKEALQDFAGGFHSWENREFQRAGSGNNIRLTFINRRERLGRDGKMLPPADFRVVQLWEKRRNRWQLVLQSSVKLAS